MPKHISPITNNDRRAVAPYNFVPPPGQVVPAEPLPAQDRYHPATGKLPRYTGRLVCTLKTAAPLYVRAGLHPEDYATFGGKRFNQMSPEEQERVAQFFSMPERAGPVIPGSSIRGMLRSLVEIASYSKLERVTDEPLVYRAVGDTTSLGLRYRARLMRDDPPVRGRKAFTPLMQAGYMIRYHGRWAIRPAQQLGGSSFARVAKADVQPIRHTLTRVAGTRNCFELWVQVGRYDYQPVQSGNGETLYIKYAPATAPSATAAPGMVAGVLAESAHMGGKKLEAVMFPPDAAATPIPVDDEQIVAYREQLSKEQIAHLGNNGVLVDGHPVFYLVEGGTLVFFGHAMMFRLPYERAPRDWVPEEARQLPAGSTHDLAEAIFGYVRGEKSSDPACAGRVFVGDGFWDQAATDEPYRTDPWLRATPLTPKILGSPKPTTFQHYLVQESANQRQLVDYAADPDATAVRGTKLYWHKGRVEINAIRDAARDRPLQEADTQHTRIKPVAAGVAFTFSLQFENLSAVELGALLWVINVGSVTQYRLSLGMGKPFGMGAVGVEAYELYCSDRSERYGALFDDQNWQQPEVRCSDKELQGFRTQFNDYIVARNGEGVTRLEQALRIQCLLVLLGWEGPQLPQSTTRYMEIERPRNHPDGYIRGKEPYNNPRNIGNEYAFRPVLPLPTEVYPERAAAVKQQFGAGSSPVTPQSGSSSQPAPQVRPDEAALTALLAEVERMRPGDVNSMMMAKVNRLLNQAGPEELRRRVADAIVAKALQAFGQMKKVEGQKWYSLLVPLLGKPSTEG